MTNKDEQDGNSSFPNLYTLILIKLIKSSLLIKLSVRQNIMDFKQRIQRVQEKKKKKELLSTKTDWEFETQEWHSEGIKIPVGRFQNGTSRKIQSTLMKYYVTRVESARGAGVRRG